MPFLSNPQIAKWKNCRSQSKICNPKGGFGFRFGYNRFIAPSHPNNSGTSSSRLIRGLIMRTSVHPLGSALVLLALAWGAHGQPAAAQTPSAQLGQPKTTTPTTQKKILFEMRDVPWTNVLEWLSNQTGLPVISSYRPTGTVNFIPPRTSDGPQKYTIPQVVDILNEMLQTQPNNNYILLRRQASFTLWPADKQIPPEIVPRVATEELADRGRTEIVSVLVQLEKLIAADLAPELKQKIGVYGEVVALSQSNQLLMQGKAGILQRIVHDLQSMESSHSGQSQTYTHKCKYIRASDAAAQIEKLLGDPQKVVRSGSNSQSVETVRQLKVTAEPGTNSILINGPADKIAQAKELLTKLDVGQQPIAVGPPFLKVHVLPTGNAEAVAKTLQEVYKDAPAMKISAIGPNKIMVWAGPEDQMNITRQLQGEDSTEEITSQTRLIPLSTVEAGPTATMLKAMFGDVAKGAPYIEAETSRNAIVVKGSPQQIQEVEAAVQTISGVGLNGDAGKMRIITLDKGSAATLAEALGQLLPQMRQNPINVILPGNTDLYQPKPRKPRGVPIKPVPTPRGLESETSTSTGEQLVDPQEKEPKKLPGNQKPITITAFGNKLIVSSDDPQALALVQELARLLTQTTATEGDFEVLRLQYADATEAAKVLDEAFNGPRQQNNNNNNNNRGGFPFGRFGGGGNASPPAEPRPDRIRIVADPSTNSLLVKASPLDLLTIRRLLGKALDVGETDSDAVMRTWILGPLQYANAQEVADTIEDVYRENMNQQSQQQSGGFRGFFFGGRSRGNSNQDSGKKKVTLSVGVDDRTNSLIVACSKLMFEDIKNLVDRLEETSKDATTTVTIVPIKNIDPALVQQALDAIQGRTTRSNSNSGNSGRFSFGGRGGGSSSGSGRSGRGSSRGNQQSRGPDFFVQPVKDDHSLTLFDPQHGAEHLQTTQFVDYQEEQPLPPGPALPSSPAAPAGPQPLPTQPPMQPILPQPQPQTGTGIPGPRQDVSVEALPGPDVLIIKGKNKADVEAVVQIIQYLQKVGAGAEVQIELVPLKTADATRTTGLLNQLFQRVNFGATATTLSVTGGTAPRPGAFGQSQAATAGAAVGSGSVFLLPIGRLNAILIAAPKARLDDIKREIDRLDVPTAADSKAVAFPLKNQSAARVASVVASFYANRFPEDATAANQIRITYDEHSNTIFVQAAPADLTEIRELIQRIDSTVSSAVSELRIIPLRNALADELAVVLTRAISEGTGTLTGVPMAAGPGAGAGPGALGALGAARPGVAGQAAGQAVGGILGRTTGTTTKVSSLRFLSPENGKIVQSGILEDVRINAEPRINSLLIAAPPKTMELLLSLIRALDVPPAARSEMNIFSLKKADAFRVAAILQQLFLGAATAAPGAALGQPVGGMPGAMPGAAPGLGAGGLRPLQLTMGAAPLAPPLIDLRISVDDRTNSLIVAGSRNDLAVIEAIVSRLEDADIQARVNRVFRLKNAIAADVADALILFISQSLAVVQFGNQMTPYQIIQKQVVIVPEPITNSLLVSATPEYFDEVTRLIMQLDCLPPQVVIQALIAEVTLTDLNEFGVEFGLQSPVLFQRSLVPGGVVLNNIPQVGVPGFNFLDPTTSMPNSSVVNPGLVGVQGLGALGVGRVSPTAGIGGFVFSAASDSVNVLVRALRTQGRLDILSRPQVMTADNQAARILVGQSYPYVVASAISTGLTGVPTVVNQINYRDVGIQLQVTPKINPDGSVVMRVLPSVSSVTTSNVQIGQGVFASAFNVQQVETTVISGDGETVAIGGLISRRNNKQENKIPWVGDLPGVGVLFRYRNQQKSKTELLIILTPHIVRSRAEADRILALEASRMDWILGDVMKAHGPSGMEPIFPGWTPPPGPGLPASPGTLAPSGPLVPPVVPPTPPDPPPARYEQLPVPAPAPAGQPQMAPAPQQVPPGYPPQQGLLPPEGPVLPVQQEPALAATPIMHQMTETQVIPASAVPMPASTIPVQPGVRSQGREAGSWRLFRKNW